jgi:hypothetical protein
MLKKFLAALTTVVLSLGLVAITAAPASAHHNDISAQVSCNTSPDGFWKVVWTVKNSENRPETITASNDESIVPVGTVIAANGTYTITKYFQTKPTSSFKLTLSAKWSNDATNTSDGWLDKNDFKDNCLPDDTSKTIKICHANQGNGWTKPTVSISSIIESNGHAVHQNGRDIIPPFSYVKQGVPGTFAGLNWTEYGQWVFDHGCSNDVTPVKPTSTNAVCTAPGQSAGTVTIPSGVVGFSYSYRLGTTGDWTDVAQGTVLTGIPVGTVQVRATVLAGYDASWGQGWTGSGGSRYVSITIGGTQANKCIAAAVPTFQNEVCNDPGTGSTGGYYIVTGTPNVTYRVSLNGAPSSVVNPATYGTQVSVPVNTTVTITATAASGYTLVGYTGPWSKTFSSAGDCLDPVVPGAATFTDSVCEPQTTGKTQGYYFIPTTPNVSYTVSLNGAPAVAATTGANVNTNPGDSVVITATAAAGYKLTGTSSWSHTFTNPGDCLDDAVPGDPVFTDSVCEPETTGTTQGTYFIPVTANVSYQVSVNGADPVPATEGVSVNTNPGDVVVITATADAGYKLVGENTWSHTFGDPGDCLDDAPTGAVTSVNQQCELIEDTQRAGKFASVLRTLSASYTSGYITIPNTPNVKYFLAPDLVNPLAPGDHDVEPGTYFVHAVADPGYQLTGKSVWELEVLESHDCDQLEEHPVVTPVVTFVQTQCTVSGSYTLAVDPAEEGAGVIWTVSNSLPTSLGKHNVTTPGKVTITATPADGYGFPEVEGEAPPVLVWEYTFNALPDDCLPTLALTGASGSMATAVLGFASLLTLGGVLLVARGRRERASAE